MIREMVGWYIERPDIVQYNIGPLEDDPSKTWPTWCSPNQDVDNSGTICGGEDTETTYSQVQDPKKTQQLTY